MKHHHLTLFLLVIVMTLFSWRVHQHIHRPLPHGISVVFVHPCTNEEAFHVLGDDRQIVATEKADQSLYINEHPFKPSAIGNEVNLIYGTRNERLIWFIADPNLTYGQAMKGLADLRTEEARVIVALPTTHQNQGPVFAQVPKVGDRPIPETVDQCPYGL